MPRFFMAGTNIKGGMAIMTGRDAEHVHVLRPSKNVDLIELAVNSYAYRREQIKSGVIETSYQRELDEIDYYRDQDAHLLFPMETNSLGEKRENYYSNYKCFNSFLQ